MLGFQDPLELKKQLNSFRHSGKTIGLVPTMGALHKGHLKLFNRSKAENDITVASIFVNPLQFNNPEDLKKYPRDLEADKSYLRSEGVDVLFNPTEDEVFGSKPRLKIDFGEIAGVLEGLYRPGHFEGVGIVVAKLFNYIQPDRAYFGLKDLQQFLLIRQMVIDLSFPIEMVGVETERDQNGLALSSRNLRLSEEGKVIASRIFSGLNKAEDLLKEGKTIINIISEMKEFYESVVGLEIEYFQIVDAENLKPIEVYSDKHSIAICVAAYVEGIRLIDNIYLRR